MVLSYYFLLHNLIQWSNLIQNSPWKDYSSNTNYAFDPYGETEEKHLGGATSTTGKDKSRHRSSSSSQQTTLQMSHSPTSKSSQYYDVNNGRSSSSRYDTNGNGTHDYRSNGHQSRGQRSSHNPAPNGENYSRSSYADRAYSLPRQVIQQQQQQQQLQQQNTMPSAGYYTQDRRSRNNATEERHRSRDRDSSEPTHARSGSSTGTDTPDFYFMPSQRKYSGEVVRVYVDYNKNPQN